MSSGLSYINDAKNCTSAIAANEHQINSLIRGQMNYFTDKPINMAITVLKKLGYHCKITE